MTFTSLRDLIRDVASDLKAQGIRIESQVRLIAMSVNRLNNKTHKEHYSVREFAHLANLSDYTVREACRVGRIRATKALSGRGRRKEWRISHVEYVRYQAEGLLGGSDDPK